MDINLANIIFSICSKEASVKHSESNRFDFEYPTANSIHMSRDMEILHMAGFTAIPMGSTLIVRSPDLAEDVKL